MFFIKFYHTLFSFLLVSSYLTLHDGSWVISVPSEDFPGACKRSVIRLFFSFVKIRRKAIKVSYITCSNSGRRNTWLC